MYSKSLASSSSTVSTPVMVRASLLRVWDAGRTVRLSGVFVPDQRLMQRGFTIDNIDQVINNTSFTTHNQIEVSQTNIKINNNGAMSLHSQASRK